MNNAPLDDDLSLRRALRALPRERDPANDLWIGIAARLPTQHAARPRRRWRTPVLFALAASLAVVAIVAVRVAPLEAPVAAPEDLVQRDDALPHVTTPRRNDLVQREADALAREYVSAFSQLGPLPPPLQPAADELDRSAVAIQQALREQPDATYLLTRLRSTYEQRLRLAQRHALT